MYDYIVVGSGFMGSVFAYKAHQAGKKVLVIEKRDHIGGNSYTKEVEGIHMHYYGPHIFHTNDEEVWEFIKKFTTFNNFINTPLARYKDEIYNLPFNMNTFNKLYGVITPKEARDKIEEETKNFYTENPKNLEEQAINMVGPTLYKKLIKDYTEKQWEKDCKDLPSFLIKRLPLRFTYNNNYFNDKYQGIPENGYTKIFDSLLEGIEVKLNTDFMEQKDKYLKLAKKVIFTGPIDEYYNYQLGHLEYRSLRFEHEVLDIEDFQGNAVVNYTSKDEPFTRIVEHKHFYFGKQPKTIITKEYPKAYVLGDIIYYTLNDDKNNNLYNEYRKLADQEQKVIFAGRLGSYKYYNMDQVIKEALNLATKELK